ncbi:hypothetical protein EDB80DRAFT_697200 [Ilyonectria destructans]|nr:hypothetical protein EDB80DRAFT_697200 [Ilyonectria destructans]
MENYDPNFGSTAKPNDILVSGGNFGCGSSREHVFFFFFGCVLYLIEANLLKKFTPRQPSWLGKSRSL